MSEVKDPAIKLFGKTIQLLPEEGHTPTNNDQHSSSTTTTSHDNKKPSEEELTGAKREAISSNPNAEELIDSSTISRINEDPKTPNADKETSSTNTAKPEDPNETTNSEEKPSKPDKILPCPRCTSLDTKFCYFNNYNVNQPRHFCKNCQRYWTAGGTMRNMPVGSGRRKNKSSSSASQYHHIIVSEALQAACAAEATNGSFHHPPVKSINASVLTFGSDVPLCESITPTLNLADKSHNNCVRNEFQHQEWKSGDDHSNLTQRGGNDGLKKIQDYPLQVPCFPAPPWPCPWNSTQYTSPMAQPTTFGHSGFPVLFYPAPQYWGCTVPSPWSMPWPLTPQSSSPDQYAPTSPLGKHSRDGSILTSSNSGRDQEFSQEKDLERGGVLIPKTLRINDPSEAAKSSLWSTLGIKNVDSSNSVSGGSLFKAFQRKRHEKIHIAEKSLVLQANPAALSRSLNFHESS